jgi:hypothetical protein
MNFTNRKSRNPLWMDELWVSTVSGLGSHAEAPEQSIVGYI